MKKKLLLLAFCLCFMNYNFVKADDKYSNTELNLNSNQATQAMPFSDVNQGDWAYQSILELATKYNLLSGYPDGTYRPDKPPTRQEIAKLLAKLVNKINQDNIQISATEKAAIRGLREEFDKEIMSLAARIEKTETKLADMDNKIFTDMHKLSDDIEDVNKRHFFTPEIKFKYAFGDYQNPGEAYANARLRLNSNTKIYKDTFATIRLQAETANLVNNSELNNDIINADLTLAYIKTGILSSWIPNKYGKIDFYGGIMPANWLYPLNNYTANVDQRAFSDANDSFSTFANQNYSISREVTDGRRASIGGEYYKAFSKYNGLIRVGVLRSTGGSIDIVGGKDVSGSGLESTFFQAMGQMDLPIKNLPTQIKISHLYSVNDNATNRDTYSVGGRIISKVNNVGLFKFAVIGFGGQVPPRMILGNVGNGFSYQFAFNPASKIFGNLFGDPDKINPTLPCYVPGKTEIGFATSNFHNGLGRDLNVYDLVISRYLSNNIFGRILFTHIDPNVTTATINKRDSILLETIFKL